MKKFFITGLLVWVPILVTFLIVKFLWEVVDKSVSLIPSNLQPEALFGFNIPGFGIILVLFILFFTGLFAANFVGKKIVSISEKVFSQIPFVRSIYKAVKQSMHVIFSPSSNSFSQVVMIEYPRKGIWSLGFVTNKSEKDSYGIGVSEDLLAIFVPTTPNPTSGYLLFLPKSEVKILDIPVDEALRIIISLGTVLGDDFKEHNTVDFVHK